MDSQTYQQIKYFLFHNINIFLFKLLSPYIYTVQKIYSTPGGYRNINTTVLYKYWATLGN